MEEVISSLMIALVVIFALFVFGIFLCFVGAAFAVHFVTENVVVFSALLAAYLVMTYII